MPPISMYDQPAQFEYMPLPFDAIARAGALRQQRFDQGQDDLARAQNAMKINADPRNIAYRNEVLKDYNDKLASVADEYLKSGDTNALRKVKQLQYQFASDPNRLALENSYQNHLLYQKDLQENKQKGVYSNLSPEYDPYASYKGIKEGGQGFNYSGMKTITDYYTPAKEMMANIKPSGSSAKYYNLDEDGNIISVKKGYEGVARQDVDRVAGAKADLFLQHKDSQFFKDLYLQHHPDATASDLKAAAKEYLKKEGEDQIFSKSDYETDMNYAPKHIAEQKAANLTTHTESEGLTRAVSEIAGLDGMDFNSDGSIKVPTTKTITERKNPGDQSRYGLGDRDKVIKLSPEEVKANEQAANAKIDALRKQYGITGSSKEVLDKYKSAIKDYGNRSIPLESVSNVAAKNIADGIIRNKAQRNFYIMDSNGSTKDGTLKTVLDELNISEEDFDKQLEKGISGYTQQGPVPGAYYVEIKSPGGMFGSDKTRRVMISPDEEMKNIFSTSYVLKKSEENLNTSVVNAPGLPGYVYKTTPHIVNGKFEFTHELGQMDKDGNFIKAEDIDLSDVMARERKNLDKSGFLGSQAAMLKPHTTE